jgi:predicted RNase H-like nuclease
MFVGADGCKQGGWVAFFSSGNGDFTPRWFADTPSLWNAARGAARVLLDVPIGLCDRPRRCDVEARRFIYPRSSSVFPAPPRWALRCRSLAEADSQKRKRTGTRQKFTRQVWNILPRIREVDALLHSDPTARAAIRECHPEVCFRSLASRPVMYSKKRPEGLRLRRKILARFVPDFSGVARAATSVFPKALVSEDDILDALVAAVTAAAPGERLRTLPSLPDQDRRGLPMEMVYFQP